MFEPMNEQGVIVKFVQECNLAGMSLLSIRTEYPDATILYKGEKHAVEFEYKSSNFTAHRHDPRECEFIICWEHDSETAMPVIELCNPNWHEFDYEPATYAEQESEYWKQRALNAEAELRAISSIAPTERPSVSTELLNLILSDEWCVSDIRTKVAYLYKFNVYTTLKEAAVVAGVSESTVSRFAGQLNGVTK